MWLPGGHRCRPGRHDYWTLLSASSPTGVHSVLLGWDLTKYGHHSYLNVVYEFQEPQIPHSNEGLQYTHTQQYSIYKSLVWVKADYIQQLRVLDTYPINQPYLLCHIQIHSLQMRIDQVSTSCSPSHISPLCIEKLKNPLIYNINYLLASQWKKWCSLFR